jgi:predicted RNA-binding Zn-ribbon protein involved in translation (DUF1610 family)
MPDAVRAGILPLLANYNGGEMKTEKRLWQCSCGNRVEVSAERVKQGLERCPNCGSVIGSLGEDYSSPSVADTQTINVRDMARMAQEGIDVGVSGEWDTSVGRRHERPPRGDDSK